MSEKRILVLADESVRRRAVQAVMEAPQGHVVKIAEPTRSLDANAAMWPILEAFSSQLKWPVNGQMVSLSAEDWKDLLTAAFQNETARLAMGLNGGVVMLGLRTSKMGKKRFSEFLDFIQAMAAERGVQIYDEEIA